MKKLLNHLLSGFHWAKSLKAPQLAKEPVALVGIFLTVLLYIHALPLSQANLLVSEDTIQFYWNQDHSLVAVVPAIKNIGRASAEEVRFRIYLAKLDSENARISKAFDDTIIHDLQPDQTAEFGNIQFAHSPKQSVIMIYHLTYKDTLGFPVLSWFKKIKNTEDNFFFFIYDFDQEFGKEKVGTLVSADYQKIQNQLASFLESSRNDSDPKLLEFIKRN
jgi:hypothetical protein